MFSKIMISTMLASLAIANPIEKRAVCGPTGPFPWFIAPHRAGGCVDAPPTFQPASGPGPGNVVPCAPLDPNPGPGFGSAAVNIPCSDYPYTIRLFTTSNCAGTGVSTTGPGCFTAAPNAPFVAYSATRNF